MEKKTIKINEKDYTLEMTRNSIKWLEAMGFSIDEFYKKPLTYFDFIWISLFISNHKDVEQNPNLAIKLMETYEKEGNKPATIVRFGIEQYKAFMNALADIDSTSKEEIEIVE